MPKINFVPELFLENTELTNLMNFIETNGYQKYISKMIKDFGILRVGDDADNIQLKIYQSSSGKIGIKAGTAFDANGKLIYNLSDKNDIATITNNSTTYKIFIEFSYTQLEEGTVQLLSNGSVIGTNTKFTEKFIAGKNIEIINSVNGNNGIYEITSVTNDTNMATSHTFNAESGLSFKFVGVFTPSVSIPDGNKRIYYYDSFTVSVESNSNTPTNVKFLLATVSNTGGTLTIVDKRSDNFLQFNDLHQSYTYANEFRIGGPSGALLDLASETPAQIKNIRIIDVNGIKSFYIENTDQINYLSKTIKSSIIDEGNLINANKLRVTFKWGWDNITGNGTSTGFTITNSITFSNNELVDSYLYIPSQNINYRISANVDKVLTLVDVNGNTVNLTGVNITTSPYAWINYNCNEYEILAIPCADDKQYENDVIKKTIVSSVDPIYMSGNLDLDIGTKYLVKVRGINGKKLGQFGIMPSGSYVKYGNTQEYGGVVQGDQNIFLVYHPEINSSGIVISATPTNFGFNVVLNEWWSQYAQQYEYCWSTDNNGADFDNIAHNRLITTKTSINVTTNISASYNIKVRPLVNGQQVASEISVDVISGAAGKAPDEVILASIDVYHATYSGTLTYNNAPPLVISAVASVKTPSDGTTSLSDLPESVVGEVITIDNKDYIITKKLAANTYQIQALNNNSMPTEGTGKTFRIGVSERARREYISKLFLDYQLSRTTFDCNSLPDGNVSISIYQQNRKPYADILLINGNDAQFEIPNDTIISSKYGERNLIVSLYDENNNLNKNGIKGRLVIYGRTYSVNANSVV